MKPEKLTAVFFLSVIITIMILAPVSIAVMQINKSAAAQKAKDVARISIDWKKLYPFENEKVSDTSEKKEKPFAYLKRKVEEYTSIYLIGRFKALEAAKKYEDIIGWNVASVYESNGVTKLYDGYLTWISRPRYVPQNTASVIDFEDYCRSKDIGFFYVNAPWKICVSEDKNISGILDFSNQNADKFLRGLDEAGVRAYDLRKILHKDGRKHHASFYKTDHHWTTETGLWAAKHILEFLRDDYGLNVDPEILNPEKFEHVVYPEWFLGYLGKVFMLSRTKPDDFTVLFPKYETNVHCEIPTLGLDTTGDFKVMCDMSKLLMKDYYHLSPYHAYSHGDQALIRITNMLSENNNHVLLIHDSFADVVTPFLAMGIKYTTAIDPRDFTGSLKKYIEANTPDIIIVMYNTAFAASAGRFFDFR